MNKPASSIGNKNKFLIFGCGFSGSFFAKTIRQYGCAAFTSSRTENIDPFSFVFNSAKDTLPDEKILNLDQLQSVTNYYHCSFLHCM